MILKFETSSSASQFNDLENLIGSFHTYTPTSSLLFVRNLGLIDGQRKLLKRYENIHIIPSSNIRLKEVEKINVNHEFVLINDTLSNRSNGGKYLFINSIRKQFYLAIVIPFIETQRNQINTKNFYSPCRNRSNSIDLIFYSNQKYISQFNYSNQCYQNIHYISIELSEEENRYPIGSALMWKKLFLSPFSLRTRGYTHFFLMEPDTRPIRSYWLDAIVEQIINGHSRESYLITKWWIIGSIYRGSKSIGNDFLHINGNALYHLTFDLIQFIENVSIEYPYDSDKSMGYDLDLFLYLFKHLDQTKTIWHKFQFTDFIQNCWHTGCNDTNQEFVYNNPNTYLIHGYKIHENKHENSLTKVYYIVLLGFSFIIARCYCRRFYFKRNYFDICKRRSLLR
jgi:hypothetical protein